VSEAEAAAFWSDPPLVAAPSLSVIFLGFRADQGALLILECASTVARAFPRSSPQADGHHIRDRRITGDARARVPMWAFAELNQRRDTGGSNRSGWAGTPSRGSVQPKKWEPSRSKSARLSINVSQTGR
jgi:hypothetical protein